MLAFFLFFFMAGAGARSRHGERLLNISRHRPPVEGHGYENWHYYSAAEAAEWEDHVCASMKNSWFSRKPVYTDALGFRINTLAWPGGRWPPIHQLHARPNSTTDMRAVPPNLAVLLNSLFDTAVPSESKRDLKESINSRLPSLGFAQFPDTVAAAIAGEALVIRMTLVDRTDPLVAALGCLSRVQHIGRALLFISFDKESRAVFEAVLQAIDFMPVLLAWHPSDYAASPFSPTNSQEMGRKINLHVMWQAAIVYDLLGATYSVNLEDDVCVGPDWHDFHVATGGYTTAEHGERYSHVLSAAMGPWTSCHMLHRFLGNSDGVGVNSLDLVSEELLFVAWGAGSGRERWVELYKSMQNPHARFRWDMQLTHLLGGRPALVPVVPRCYVLPNKGHDGHGTAYLHRFPMHSVVTDSWRTRKFRVVHYEDQENMFRDQVDGIFNDATMEFDLESLT
jgi:hypothetical protein